MTHLDWFEVQDCCDRACSPFRFMKTMGLTGMDLTVSMEEVAVLPAPGVSVTDALGSYVEAVQV